MIAAAAPAAAQTTPAPAAEATVVVTASRVERAGFTAPTPTAIQSAAVLQAQGFTNLTDLLEQSPAIHGSADQRAGNFNTDQNNLYTNPAATYIALRNLGSGQTGSAARSLTLVDGNRFVFESTGGAVNINAIPTIALDRTEIVTGGSSAAYGSEAIAGVVNLILKKNYTGLQFEASGGVSTYGDAKSMHLAGIAGGTFMGGKLHLMGAAQVDSNTGIANLQYNPRGWAAAAYGTIVGAGNIRYFTNDIQVTSKTYGGLVTGATVTGSSAVVNQQVSGPLHGITFGPGGTPMNLVYGNLYGNAANSLMSGGGNKYDNNNDTAPLMLPVRRAAFLFRANYDVTDHIQAIFTLNAAASSTDHPTVTNLYTGGSGIAPVNFAIKTGNPFIPASIQSIMNTNNYSSIVLGKVNRDFGPFEVHGDDHTYQANLDFKGDFDALGKGWTWDTHAAYGTVTVNTSNLTDTVDANVQNALDVVAGPSGPMCASATARAAGCVPYNPFGDSANAGNTALKNYIQRPSDLREITTRTDFNGNLRGDPFSTWAGPVSMAVGGEWRRDSIDEKSSALAQGRFFYGDNNQPFSGNINVVEGYAEAVIPLLKDVFLAKSVDFDGSVREAHYDKSGDTFSYKAGGTWAVSDEFHFRGSVSQDARAPNVTELFYARSPAAALFTEKLPDPTIYHTQADLDAVPTQNIVLGSTASSVQTNGITQGNLALKPEIAQTVTYGVVFAPTAMPWMRGLRASVDYYDITIANAVFTPAAATVAGNCQTLKTASACADLHYVFVNGVLNSEENLKPQNIAAIKTSGVDINVDYVTPLSRFYEPAPGTLVASYAANYVAHLDTILNGLHTDRAGEVGGGVITTGAGTPHWVWDANFNYKVGSFGYNLHVHYVGGGVLDNSAKPGGPNFGLLSMNNVPSRTTYNLGIQYDLPKAMTWNTGIQVYMNVNNVLNADPPAWGRDGTVDTIGRYYTAGFRVKL